MVKTYGVLVVGPNSLIFNLNPELSLKERAWPKDESVVFFSIESGSATEPAGQHLSSS